MSKQPIHILRQLKKGLAILLFFAVVCEIFFFPTLPNFFGCVMAVIAYWVFSFFLKEKYIRLFPFAFCVYVSMFMYRYLPLIATIVEGKPITYGFERPYQTFVYEIILFLVSSFAFYLACRKPRYTLKNNSIQKTLFQLKFFEITPSILWGIGLIGLFIRLYNFGVSDVEYGDVSGKFLQGLDYLMYAPLCLFFPSLLRIQYSNQKLLWIYSVCIFIVNIASNSRQSIMSPIAILLILSFFYVVIHNLKITTYISPVKILFLGLFSILAINLLSHLSLAMLHTRKIRDDVDKMELFEKTVETAQNETLMARLKAGKESRESGLITYKQGWTEHYVDNFILARYANMRITDETLYYAQRKGFANRQMQIEMAERILAIFPTPLLRLFGLYLDKNKMEYSRGDFLYGRGFGGYRVTSHVADGLATFGFWYFPIQFIAFFIMFKLLNSFVLYSRKGILYAPFALMNVFLFLGKFRNAQGISAEFSYIIRGFLQGVITYLIIFHMVRLALQLINPKLVKMKIQNL
ncbi:hypothetical protein [Ulvibacterium marinum]|uniref:hypothetical protein n=1 Tax=Ulvibacterium marinum TaxID=2419782 RepID=UPI00249488E1|nr:hypothetical protein [Ulvibacterium marinum]